MQSSTTTTITNSIHHTNSIDIATTTTTNNVQFNTKLFFKVWHNNILKNKIIFHIRLFNIYRLYKICIDVETTKLDGDILYTLLRDHKDYVQRLAIRFDSNFQVNNQLAINYINSTLFPSTIHTIDLTHPSHDDFQPDIFDIDNNNSGSSSCKSNSDSTLVLSKGSIPNTIKTLIYENVLVDQDSIVIPDSITSLKFSYNFDTRSVRANSGIPLFSRYSALKYLHLGFSFNEEIGVNVLPDPLEELHLSSLFNHSLHPNVLPLNLKKIYFGIKFNQQLQVNSIPPSVVKISFGSHYNMPLVVKEGLVIPASCKSIRFGKRFNQALFGSSGSSCNNNSLIKSLFNKIVVNKSRYYYLPESITKLKFETKDNSKYNKKLDITNLYNLQILECNSIPKFEKLPNSISKLSIEYGGSGNNYINRNNSNSGIKPTKFLSIPSNQFIGLVKLKLLSGGNVFEIDTTLPKTLRSITISASIILNHQSIPSSVSTLKGIFKHHIESIKSNSEVMHSITRLVCFKNYYDLKSFINLKSLTIFKKSKKHIMIPNNVISLSYGVYNSPLEPYFPSSVTSLYRFGGELALNSLLTIAKLESIKMLCFKYIGRIGSSKLPSQLQVLFLFGNSVILDLDLPLPSSLHTIYLSDTNKEFFKDQDTINLISQSCTIKIIKFNLFKQVYKSTTRKIINNI